MNFILLFISWLLKLIGIPIGIVLTIWVFLLEPKTFIKSMSGWFYDIALATDKWGGVVLQHPLNKWFIIRWGASAVSMFVLTTGIPKVDLLIPVYNDPGFAATLFIGGAGRGSAGVVWAYFTGGGNISLDGVRVPLDL